jgi:hypothetical protein
MGGGADFQARVAARLAVHMLAEQDAQSLHGLTAPIAWVGCESGEAVDDVLVRTEGGHSAYLQAKSGVSLTKRRRNADGRLAPFASAIDQFIRQYLTGLTKQRDGTGAALDPVYDRLALVVGRSAPASVRDSLARAIDRASSQSGSGPLIPATLNRAEHDALSVFLEHARASWKEVTSASPTDQDLQEFLRLVRIDVADVEAGQTDESASKNLLRQAVLEVPSQADLAWGVLINIGTRLIRSRSTVAPAELRSELIRAGIRVKGPRSYQRDIARLLDHTESIRLRLADYGSVRVGTDRVVMKRPYAAELRTAAEDGPVLVVGEPGAGKSGVIYELATALAAEGRDIILLAAEDPPFASPGELRSVLGLEHDVAEILANWPGDKPAFLLVDALDAARSDQNGQALRRLMTNVKEKAGRWHIVASIREYDARYGHDVRHLFSGPPVAGSTPPLPGPEFSTVRHLVVGGLTKGEVDQLAGPAPELFELVSTALPALAELFHNAFNVRLAAELLEYGVALDAIRGVRSQLGLLDLYWDARVLRDGPAKEADAREAVLRTAVERMVQDRSLRIDRDMVARDASHSPALSALLRAHVLVEWTRAPGAKPERSALTFPHHILFDYAVARLLFRVRDDRLSALLASDSPLVLLARPSLVMHFHHRWDESDEATRREYWELVLAIAAESPIPEIGKLIGPQVAVERIRRPCELDVLVEALQSTDQSRKAAAENAFNHLIRAALPVGGQVWIAQDQIDTWCDLAERVSRSMSVAVAYPLRTVLWELTERFAEFSTAQQQAIGNASRRSLEFAWRREPRDRGLVIHAIGFVCRAFTSNPHESATLLRRALKPDHIRSHGHEELVHIAEHVGDLAAVDAALIRDLYIAAFGFRESSNEPSPMGGIVMRLVSNRRQDYEGALYQLARKYPAFLKAAPEHAVTALHAALESYVALEHAREGEQVDRDVEVAGVLAKFRPDYSAIWDRGGHRDDPVRLLDHLVDRLEELAESADQATEFMELLKALLHDCRLACVWRRLLLVGSRQPEAVGIHIRAAAWSPVLLASSDTSVPAGKLISAIAPFVTRSEVERIERTILSLPSEMDGEYGERIRDRLLGCLADVELVTPEAREQIDRLRSANAIPPNNEDFDFSISSRAFGEEEYLTELGVAVEDEGNRRIRELEAPVQEFASSNMNKTPSTEEVEAIRSHVLSLRAALESAEADGVHDAQGEYAWDCMADACSVIARLRPLSCEGGIGEFTRETLLIASRHTSPKASGEDDEFINPSWSRPAVRVVAAQGLATLAFDSSCADEEVLAALERLLGDPAPSVRFQVACRLINLYQGRPDWVWTQLEDRGMVERSPGVVVALVRYGLANLRFIDSDRVADIVLKVHRRFEGAPGEKEVQNACVDVLCGLYLRRDHPRARQLILEMADSPGRHLHAASHLAPQFRDILTEGPVDESDAQAEAARSCAFEFLLRLTRSAAELFRVAVEGDQEELGAHRDELQSVAHLLDSIGFNLYVASGALDDKKESPGSTLSPEESRRLWQEAEPIIQELAKVGLPRLTHHLLETLETFIASDPDGVFMAIAELVRGGRKGGYEYDSMAEKVLIRVIERYLAEYRSVFQKSEMARRALVEVLDTFVQAGSPGARRLSYGLDGIFR